MPWVAEFIYIEGDNNIDNDAHNPSRETYLKLKEAQNSIPTFEGTNSDDLEIFLNCC